MVVNQDGTLCKHSSDDYFAVLSEEHQQAVVSILVETDRSVTLSPLAEEVAAVLARGEREGIAERDVNQVEAKLHHHYLPKLDAAGLLEYCSEDHRIVPTEGLKTVIPPKTAALN